MDKEKKNKAILIKRTCICSKTCGKERTLEQLKLDIKGIQELDHKIDEALDTFFNKLILAMIMSKKHGKF